MRWEKGWTLTADTKLHKREQLQFPVTLSPLEQEGDWTQSWQSAQQPCVCFTVCAAECVLGRKRGGAGQSDIPLRTVLAMTSWSGSAPCGTEQPSSQTLCMRSSSSTSAGVSTCSPPFRQKSTNTCQNSVSKKIKVLLFKVFQTYGFNTTLKLNSHSLNHFSKAVFIEVSNPVRAFN